jgi:hypothetical protein
MIQMTYLLLRMLNGLYVREIECCLLYVSTDVDSPLHVIFIDYDDDDAITIIFAVIFVLFHSP